MRRIWLLSALSSVMFVLTSCSALYYPGDDYLNGAIADAAPFEAAADGPATADASDAAIALVCPANALLCDDFERSKARGQSWQASGDVAIDADHAHSPQRSLLATTVSGGDPSSLEQTVAVPARTRFDVWFYTPGPPPGRGLNFRIAQMLWGDACDWDLTWELIVNANDGLGLNASTYDRNMNGSCGPIANQAPPQLLAPSALFTDRWHHAVIIGDTRQQKRQVLVDIDDSGTFVSITVTGSRSNVPANAAVAVGIPCVRTDSGCFTYNGPDYRVWIDDLVVAPD